MLIIYPADIILDNTYQFNDYLISLNRVFISSWNNKKSFIKTNEMNKIYFYGDLHGFINGPLNLIIHAQFTSKNDLENTSTD